MKTLAIMYLDKKIDKKRHQHQKKLHQPGWGRRRERNIPDEVRDRVEKRQTVASRNQIDTPERVYAVKSRVRYAPECRHRCSVCLDT
jgi:hypothetical protein